MYVYVEFLTKSKYCLLVFFVISTIVRRAFRIDIESLHLLLYSC